MPKSPSGPAGLWLAVSRKPPAASWRRIKVDAAGVDRMPPWPTMTRATPLPAAIAIAVSIASRLWYRPSPPITSVRPRKDVSTSKIDCRKFSR